MQLSLFRTLERTVASPLCVYDRCERKGRAVIGPPVVFPGCVNRAITCLDCRATGQSSENTNGHQ